MSDRVRFLTRNDTVTLANSSGCNGFPFPFVTGNAIGDGTLYPINTGVARAAKWWWRVRRWALSTNIVVDVFGNDADFSTITELVPSGVHATREYELTGTSPRHEFAGGGTVIGTLAFAMELYIFDDGGQRNINWTATTLHPRIDINAVVSDNINIYWNLSSQTYVPSDGSISGSVDGQPLTLTYIENSGTTTGSSLILTPLEFWPYAATDGTPIYDTSTGAQLQSPTN